MSTIGTPVCTALLALAAMLALAALVWLASLARRDASLADRFWPAFIVLAGAVYAMRVPALGARGAWVAALALAWALRLGVYITWRNWGRGEDRRYAQMRAQHGAAFGWRSVFTVFVLQAVLAWIVSAPLLAAIGSAAPLWALDALGIAVCLAGIVLESVADAQMAAFRRAAAGQGAVMDRGLWRYSRHPNYFGEACVWWGLGLVALAAGGAWALVSPLLMTVLLLRVSGVSLLERDIAERHPAYRDYVARTNAFVPGPPKRSPP